MKPEIKMVAVDVDGTFVHSDYTYDVQALQTHLSSNERGRLPFCGDFFDLTSIYYHRLQWVDDFKEVNDQILKFAPTVPAEKTYEYYDMFRERLKDRLEPTTSGHGSIDLIMPGCHKASGLKRLAARWGITPEQCAAFGDGGNDIEMLRYCAHSYAMGNAPQNVKDAAKYVCPSNEEDGVLITLEKLFGGTASI